MIESRPHSSSLDASRIRRPHVVRRRYLIDPKRQLRTAVMTTSSIVILALIVNFGFAVLRISQTSFLTAAAPKLTPLLEEQATTFTVITIAVSIALVIAVALITIVQTHRTAGAVYAVKQRFQRVKAGDLQVTLRLRQRDNLQDLEQPFNEMIVALRNRALDEADALDKLALKSAEIGSDGTEIATALAELARLKRRMGT